MTYDNEEAFRRQRTQDLSKFSPDHFAVRQLEASKDKPRNKVEVVNKIGARYAVAPTAKDAQDLVIAFHAFLMKYVKLLTPGPIPFKPSSETRDFLRLFMAKSEAMAMGYNAAYRMVSERLPNMAIQSMMSADDLYNELVVIFLEKAQKFNPEIGGFTGYIKYHFKYAVI